MRFMLNITEIMKKLAKNRPIFHSEADFQFALAWEIQKAKPNGQVRLEYPFGNGPERKYLDIWLQDMKIAIELKYRTQQLNRVINDESFVLKPHEALDTGRYGFIRDVKRIERVRQRKPSATGFAVLLTNDPLFWDNSPKNKTQAADFLIYDGRVIKDEMKWPKVKKWMKENGVDKPIKLDGCYELNWQDYSNCGAGKYRQFRYLAVKVPCLKDRGQ